MATDQAAQWSEPSTRESVTNIAETALRRAATAVNRAGVYALARRAAGRARLAMRLAIKALTDTLSRCSWRRRGVPSAAEARRFAESLLGITTLWAAGLAAAALVFNATASWPEALLAGTCVFALAMLSSMRAAQRLEALALHEQLEELRLSLRVTQALLDVEELEGVAHLEQSSEELHESGTRLLTRISPP